MESVPEPAKKKLRRRVLLAAANLLSIACLWWVLRDIDWREFRSDVRDINYWWLSFAALVDVGVYFCQGWRWSLLLVPVERIPVLRSVRAIYVGLFANEVLPLRAGELIRCYLQARWSSLPFSVTLSSALIERIFDGFFLVACVFTTVRIVPNLPRAIVDGAYVLSALIVLGAILIGIAMFYKQRAHSALAGGGWRRHLRVLIDDLHLIGHSRYLYFAALTTIPYLLLQVVTIFAIMKGYNFGDASWGVAAVLMIVLRLAAAVPQAPGNVGTFNLLTVIILYRVFGYDKGFAQGFSIVMWVMITLPLMIVGFIALVITETHLGELRRKAKSEMPAYR
jgi:glycosyltransferase 2 family protein